MFAVIKEHNVSSPLYLHVAHAAAHVGGGLVNLQAPGEDVAANSHIAHSARRLYAGQSYVSIVLPSRSYGNPIFHVVNILSFCTSILIALI